MHRDGSGSPRLLVTGASGVLGWTLCRQAAARWQTFGTVLRNPVEPPGVQVHRIDLTRRREVVGLFRSIRPDAVIHAAALSSPDYCQQHPTESEAANVAASTYVAAMCAEFSIPCVFTSSDLVFDGEHALYDEESAAEPVSIYGEHKLRAEEEMRARYPSITVCRLPLMFGEGSPAAHGYFRRALQSMKQGAEVRLFTDEMRTPVSTATAAEGLMMALRSAQGETLHLGGGGKRQQVGVGTAHRRSLLLRQRPSGPLPAGRRILAGAAAAGRIAGQYQGQGNRVSPADHSRADVSSAG
ncbi:SDR family oxidoreductase [Verrucomicrobiota bacterium]